MQGGAESVLEKSLAEVWSQFCRDACACHERLLGELRACWRDQHAVLEQQLQEWRLWAPAAGAGAGLRELQSARRDALERLLSSPAAAHAGARAWQRALAAIQACDRGLEELVRALPEEVEAAGLEVLAAVVEDLPHSWPARLLLRRRGRRCPVAVRAAAAAALGRLSAARIPIEGRLLLTLARGAHRLRAPWDAARAALDAVPGGKPGATPAAHGSELERLAAAAARQLATCDAWRGRMLAALARGLAFSALRPPGPRRPAHPRRQQAATRRVSQARGVDAGLRDEGNLAVVEHAVLGALADVVDSAAAEHAALQRELARILDWLENNTLGVVDFPEIATHVVPAESRLAELDAAFRPVAEALPESAQTLARLPSRAGRPIRRRDLRPRAVFEQACLRTLRPAARRLLEHAEAEHRQLAQAMEQAREVLAFAAAQTGDWQSRREALQNSLHLLRYYKRDHPDWRPAAERRLVEAAAAGFSDARLLLATGVAGGRLHLSFQALRGAAPGASRSAAESARAALFTVARSAAAAGLRFLVWIGWRSRPRTGRLEVVTRPSLPPEFILDPGSPSLPAIYRHLFSFDPVADPRFLVGRGREMDAIAEARSFWQSGRPAAVLIVGERGSGKTSLINCAAGHALRGLEVVRGEFRERLVAETQMREFLARLVGAPSPDLLERHLAERPRVVVLEELERSFLRQVGHYEAVRTLERVLAATCPSTLWVLSVNDVAFRFLDAALQLRATFSHRIDASTATREDLRHAIELRHRLSGLRLEYAAPPGRRSRWRSDQQPADLFFDALASLSAGVFRTAFDIWLGHIEAVESGVMYMKPLVPRNLDPVFDDLGLADLFTLVAILQHGGLTAEEHAAIFQTSIARGRAQIDELIARELVEAEPGRRGYRVRPQALRVVKEGLFRRNLL